MADAFTNQTDAAKAGLNQTVRPVDHFVTAGLQKRILEVLDVRCAWLGSAEDKMTALQRMHGNQASGNRDTLITYPYGFLSLESEEIDETRGNVAQFAKKGIVTHFDDVRGYRAHIMPVITSVKFEYVTNSYLELSKFINKFMFARRLGWLKFNVLYGRITLAVGVNTDNSLQVPSREGGDATAEAKYTLETNLMVAGWKSLPTLIEQQIVNKVNLEVTDPAGSVLWSYKTPVGEGGNPLPASHTSLTK